MTLRYRRLLDRLQQGDFARGAAGSSSVVGLLSAALLSRWKPTWLG